jgi:hypothetical protein
MSVYEPRTLESLLYSTVEGRRLQANGKSRLLDHAPDPGPERRVDGAAFESGISVEEEHDLDSIERRLQGRRFGEVSPYQIHLTPENITRPPRVTHEGLERYARLGEQPDQRSSNVTGRTGYQDHPCS